MNAPMTLRIVTSGGQLIKTHFAGFRMRGGIRWSSSCRAVKKNQRVKQSGGTMLNTPVGTKDSNVREVSVER